MRGTPLSVEAQTLLRLVADGQWHPYEEIAQQVMATVAPGKALRRYEDRRAKRMAREPFRRRMAELSDQEKISSGRRLVSNRAFNSMKTRFIDVEWRGGERMVRRRPQSVQETAPVLTDPQVPAEPSEPVQEPVTGVVEESAAESAMGFLARPEICTVCGSWIINIPLHQEFHQRETQAAIEQLRELVRAEVDEGLDSFQRGFQDFLMTALANLELNCRHSSVDR